MESRVILKQFDSCNNKKSFDDYISSAHRVKKDGNCLSVGLPSHTRSNSQPQDGNARLQGELLLLCFPLQDGNARLQGELQLLCFPVHSFLLLSLLPSRQSPFPAQAVRALKNVFGCGAWWTLDLERNRKRICV